MLSKGLTCKDCGARVSKPQYLRCRACAMRLRSGKMSNLWTGALVKRCCLICKKKFFCYLTTKSGKSCSRQCSALLTRKNGTQKGQNNPAWKGKSVGYYALHTWLQRNFGTPSQCDVCGTKHAKRFDWAKIRGKQSERKRENFFRLCKSCHIKYDSWGYSFNEPITKTNL